MGKKEKVKKRKNRKKKFVCENYRKENKKNKNIVNRIAVASYSRWIEVIWSGSKQMDSTKFKKPVLVSRISIIIIFFSSFTHSLIYQAKRHTLVKAVDNNKNWKERRFSLIFFGQVENKWNKKEYKRGNWQMDFEFYFFNTEILSVPSFFLYVSFLMSLASRDGFHRIISFAPSFSPCALLFMYLWVLILFILFLRFPYTHLVLVDDFMQHKLMHTKFFSAQFEDFSWRIKTQ